MANDFWKDLVGHFLKSSGYVFTVGGVIVGLTVPTAYWPLSLMMLLLISTTSAAVISAYRLHSLLRKNERDHSDALARTRAELSAALEKSADLEQKLNEIPSHILLQLEHVIAVNAFSELSRALIGHAELIRRMRDFERNSAKPLALRALSRQGDVLFAAAKADPLALAHLQLGDPFVLMRRSSNGLEVPAARMTVHQAPDLSKGVVFFRIVDVPDEEAQQLDSLARSGDKEASKKYNVRKLWDMSRYAELDLAMVSRGIRQLVEELAEGRREGLGL